MSVAHTRGATLSADEARELLALGRRRIPQLLKPGWCLLAMLGLFPLWWVLGLSGFIYPIMAVPMAVALLRRRPIVVPPGFGWWLLFLLWSLVGIFVLGVNPPGTVAEGAGDRIIGYATRQVQYLSATVILLYVGNLREFELPKRTVVKLLAWMFMITTAGGVLGTLLPRFEFTSPFEMVLPAGVAQNAYVQSLVHPAAAQVQDFFGADYARAKAPWEYTNTWGFMIVLLAVFFVAAAFSLTRVRHPVLSGLFLTVAGALGIASLNRGTWLLMGLAVVVVVVRLALRGKTLALSGIVIGVVLAAVVVLASPLKGLIVDRLEEGKSDAIREQTTEQTFEIVSLAPITGYGSTRSAQGSNQTITAGRTSSCPACGNAVLGSNGYAFKLLVSTGVVGTAFFVMFFLVMLWRHRWDESPIGTASVVAIVLTLVAGFFYDVVPNALAYPMLALALLWRLERDAEPQPIAQDTSEPAIAATA